MIIVDFEWYMVVTLIASTVLPLLVGLVTTRDTNPKRKAILLAALSVLIPLTTSLADALVTGSEWGLASSVFIALTGFLISVGMHFGFWKPTGVADKAQAAFTK